MPVMDARHDRMHPVEGDSAWSESYYFNAYDPDADVGIYSRIGIRPNEGHMDAGMAIWLPGQEIAHLGGRKEQKSMCESPLVVEGVRYECLEPAHRWRLTAEGKASVFNLETRQPRNTNVALDMTFDAQMPPIGTDGQGKEGSGASAETRKSVGKGHLEQGGRWTGWIEADGKRHALGRSARGNRDKSWGPRRWGGPKMWRWFSINISDGVHFGGIRIGTDSGDLHRGWVWKDGAHSSIEEWRVRTVMEKDRVTQKTCFVTAMDKQGRHHELRADLLRVSPGGARPGGTIVNEGLARWTYEGVAGYGIAEYLHQFDKDGNPLVPIE